MDCFWRHFFDVCLCVGGSQVVVRVISATSERVNEEVIRRLLDPLKASSDF